MTMRRRRVWCFAPADACDRAGAAYDLLSSVNGLCEAHDLVTRQSDVFEQYHEKIHRACSRSHESTRNTTA